MTRWVRFALTVLRSMLRPRLRADRESRLTFRVWPTDVDLSVMNHATYLTLMEQGRIDFMLRTGFLRFLLRRRWSAVLSSMSVQYRTPLRRFQKCELRTRVACWDDRWIYVEQRLGRGADFVASGLARVAVLERAGRLRPENVLSDFGLTVSTLPVADTVRALQESERSIHQRIREWPVLDWSVEA